MSAAPFMIGNLGIRAALAPREPYRPSPRADASDECMIIRRNRLTVLPQAREVPHDGIRDHRLRFIECSSVRHAPRQTRNDCGEPALRLRSKEDMVGSVSRHMGRDIEYTMHQIPCNALDAQMINEVRWVPVSGLFGRRSS